MNQFIFIVLLQPILYVDNTFPSYKALKNTTIAKYLAVSYIFFNFAA